MNPLLPDRRAEDLALLAMLKNDPRFVFFRPKLKTRISSRSSLLYHALHFIDIIVEVGLDLDDLAPC